MNTPEPVFQFDQIESDVECAHPPDKITMEECGSAYAGGVVRGLVCECGTVMSSEGIGTVHLIKGEDHE